MKKKRELQARQAAASSTLVTPSALATFPASILSSACSKEATPVTQTSVVIQTQTTVASTTVYATSVTTTIAPTAFRTVTNTLTITSGIVTNPTSTVTTTTTIYTTTTIVVPSGAPDAPPNYLKIVPDPNGGGANWAVSDDSHHMTDNFYIPNKREVFEISTLGELYSVTNNGWYYVNPGSAGRSNGKLFWDSSRANGGKGWYGVALNDGSNYTQVFLRNTTTGFTYNFCIANIGSGDRNGAYGYHMYFYATADQVTYCNDAALMLTPVGQG